MYGDSQKQLADEKLINKTNGRNRDWEIHQQKELCVRNKYF